MSHGFRYFCSVFQEVAPIAQHIELVAPANELRHLERYKVDIRPQDRRNLFCGVVVVIDIIQYLLIVQENDDCHNICLILWLRCHVVKGELMEHPTFFQLPVHLIMPQLMSADNSLYPFIQSFSKTK